MGKKPQLDNLDFLFESGKDFEITGKLYEEKAGTALPQDINYLKRRSALAKKAKEKGFIIDKVDETPIIEKTVYFKHKEV